MENTPNLTDLQDYFNFLLGVPDGFVTYGWEDTKTKKFIEGYKTGICRVSFLPAMYESILKKFPDSLPNLHVTLNETSVTPNAGGFRNKASIKASRVICLDLDRDVSEDELTKISAQFSPALVIESSPNHFHMYWKLSPGGVSIKPSSTGVPAWTMYQLAFANKFSGDLNRSDITSTIRVPGFPRLTKQGEAFVPYVVGLKLNPKAWSEQELVTHFDWIADSAIEGLKRLQAQRKETASAARARAAQIRTSTKQMLPYPELVTAPAGRNATLYDYMSTLAFETGLSEADAIEQARLINQSFAEPPGPLDDDECTSAAVNGWRHGIEGFNKRRERSLAVIEPIESAILNDVTLKVTGETKLTLGNPLDSGLNSTIDRNPANSITTAVVAVSHENIGNGISPTLSESSVPNELPLTIDITRTDTSFTVLVSNGNGSFIDDTGDKVLSRDSSIDEDFLQRGTTTVIVGNGSDSVKTLTEVNRLTDGDIDAAASVELANKNIQQTLHVSEVRGSSDRESLPSNFAVKSLLSDFSVSLNVSDQVFSSANAVNEAFAESLPVPVQVACEKTQTSTYTNGHAANNEEHKVYPKTTHLIHKERAADNSQRIEAESLNGANSKDLSTAKSAAFSVKVNPYATKINKAFNIPEASSKFGEVLWKHKEIALATLLKCFAHHSFQYFAELMAKLFTEVGCYTRTGMMISLNRTIEWGEQVTYLFDLQTQNLPSFSRHAVLKFTDRLLTDPETKDLQDNLKKGLTDRQLQDITRLFIDETYNQPYIEIQNENLIVFQNGYMDVTTGVFNYDLNAPITYSNPIMAHYIPDEAKHPKMFLRYMQDWFPNDSDIIIWMYRWFGYCMTTDTRRQCFAFFFGKARAGKGSLAQLLCKLLGSQNITSIDYDALIDPFRFSSASGKLVITIDEVKATISQHDRIIAQVKKISGGERVQFNPKFKKPYEEKITAKMIMQSNDVIEYEDKSHSLRARLMAVGFEKPFIEEATREPSAVILEHDANILASICAREYSRAVQSENWKDCFKFPNSRALQQGFTEVTEHISIDSLICNRYLKVDRNFNVKGQALHELFELCNEGKETKFTNVRIGHFFSEITSVYGPKGVNKSENLAFGKDKKRARGFENLNFNKDVLLKEHPELIEDISNLSFKYPHLYEALEISLTDDFVLSKI